MKVITKMMLDVGATAKDVLMQHGLFWAIFVLPF